MSKNQTKTIPTLAKIEIKPRKLGRGLSALLGEPVAITLPGGPAAAEESEYSPRVAEMPGNPGPAGRLGADRDPPEEIAGRVRLIDVAHIQPGPYQPRKAFDEGQLRELAESIKSAGVVQPILVRPRAGDPQRFELIAGERRWRASKIAGLTRVPAVVSDLSDELAAQWGLIENLQRADLTAMERAWAVKSLCEKFALTHAEVAQRLGIDRSSAANLMRLTELEPEVQSLLESGELGAGHGKALLGAIPGSSRVSLAKNAAGQGWSVRRLEQAIGRVAQFGQGGGGGGGGAVKMSEGALAKAAALKDLEKQLSEHLGTNVRVRASAGGKRGSLVLKFYDLDHFDGLMQKMGFSPR